VSGVLIALLLDVVVRKAAPRPMPRLKPALGRMLKVKPTLAPVLKLKPALRRLLPPRAIFLDAIALLIGVTLGMIAGALLIGLTVGGAVAASLGGHS
jgi:hypothetical protein